jgi:hypothetical protein
MDKSGVIVWTSPELLHECDRRANEIWAQREELERNGENQNTNPQK